MIDYLSSQDSCQKRPSLSMQTTKISTLIGIASDVWYSTHVIYIKRFNDQKKDFMFEFYFLLLTGTQLA